MSPIYFTWDVKTAKLAYVEIIRTMERGVRLAAPLPHPPTKHGCGWRGAKIGIAVRSRLLRVARKTRIDSSYETLLFVDGFDNGRCRASNSSTSFLLEFRDGLTDVCRDGQRFLLKSWVILFRAPRGHPFFVVTSWSRAKRFERCVKFRRTRAICYFERGRINNYSAISMGRGDEASIR